MGDQTKMKLFEPFQFGKLKLKNRIVMAPMCMYSVEKKDGELTTFHNVHYASRAIGGVGLIILEATAVSEEGRISDRDLGLWNHDQMIKLKGLVSTIHEFGSRAGIQLSHAGRKAEDAKNLVAPSAIAYSGDYQVPSELTLKGIEKVIADFKSSAQRAADAEIDVIQIHAAHGYLINQFLSPITNQRNDHYGAQSLENRFRLLKEIILEIKKVFKGSIWVRYSATDYDEGSTTIEEFNQMNQWLEALSVEVIDVSTGGLLPKRPTMIYPGYQTQYAKYFKDNSGLKVATVGKLGDPNLANHILETEQADLISLGRPLLRNPNWPMMAAKELGYHQFEPYNASYGRGFNE